MDNNTSGETQIQRIRRIIEKDRAARWKKYSEDWESMLNAPGALEGSAILAEALGTSNPLWGYVQDVPLPGGYGGGGNHSTE